MIDTTSLIRAGQRFGLTIAEAEAGCRDLMERTRPATMDSTWFDVPAVDHTPIESLIQRQINAARDAQERRDRQAAFLLFGVHL